jgi:hypothetical protein
MGEYRPCIGAVKAPQSLRRALGQSMWQCHTPGCENVAAVPIAGPAGRGVYLAARHRVNDGAVEAATAEEEPDDDA